MVFCWISSVSEMLVAGEAGTQGLDCAVAFKRELQWAQSVG